MNGYAYARTSRVPLDGYLRYRQSFYRTPAALVHQRVTLGADRDATGFTTRAHRARNVGTCRGLSGILNAVELLQPS